MRPFWYFERSGFGIAGPAYCIVDTGYVPLQRCVFTVNGAANQGPGALGLRFLLALGFLGVIIRQKW